MKNSARFVHGIMAVLCLLVLVSCDGTSGGRWQGGAGLISIEVTPVDATMYPGGTQQFYALGHYTYNTTKDITSLVRWSVEFTDVLWQGGIDTSGLLKATLGSGRVIATGGQNWDITGEANFSMVDPWPISLTVTPVDPIIAVGESLQFSAILGYVDGSILDVTSEVNWFTSDIATATIMGYGSPSMGLTTSHSVGVASISAEYYVIEELSPSFEILSNSTTLTVTDAALVSLAITPADPSMTVGNSLQLTATGTYSDATTGVPGTLTWSSSDTGTTTISATGEVLAVAPGTTEITATSGAVSTTTMVTVDAVVTTPIVTTGTMVKGSAIVNGIAYSDTLATITADDVTKDATFLQSGMTVKLKGSRNSDGLTGDAAEIEVKNEVRGELFSKGFDSFSVLGQTVYVDGGTIFAGVADFAALNSGDPVEVYGLRNAAGSIRATRVELLGAAGVDEVRGTINAQFGSGSISITIDTGGFNVDGTTTVLPTGASFDVGTLVEIELTGQHVDQLKVEDAFDAGFIPASGEEFAVEGFISGFTDLTGNFMVNGQTVDASGAELVGGVAADLDNDVKVIAKGHYIGSILVADRLEIKDALQLIATISASAIQPWGLGEITVLGKTVFITSNTVGRGNGPYTAGEGVQVWGFLNLDGTTITATRIALVGPVAADVNSMQWQLSSYNATTLHLGLLGFDVDASGTVQFLDKADAVITDAQFFGQLTDRSIVRATGTVSGSVLTANWLEIE